MDLTAKKGSKLVSLLMSFAVAASVTSAVIPEDIKTVNAVSVMTADQITLDMGLGWNLGNSLDANTPGKTYSDIYGQEQEWGNPIVTKALVDAVKAKGFNTIRIPTTWYQHITEGTDSNGNKTYTIDPEWLKRVKTVVDYAIENDMYVILNVHHETWVNRDDFVNAYSNMSAELIQVWQQIAKYFKDYDQHLIFEGLNEPRMTGHGDKIEWGGTTECFDVINKLDADFVRTVRSVDSDYQYTRLLMVPGYAASADLSVYGSLRVPGGNGCIDKNSDGIDDYVAVSIHAYKPYEFAMGNGDHTTFSSAYKSALSGIFNDIRATFTSKDIPVIIGEFSASNYGNNQARNEWATYYMYLAKEMGIPCVLWDNNCPSNGGSEAHGYLNRADNTWYSENVSVVNCMFAVMNDENVVWNSKSKYPLYSHGDMSTGTKISQDEWGTINSAVSDIKKNTEIAIKYGTVIPSIAFADSGWGGWTELSPYDYDTDKGIAYYSCDAVLDSWSSSLPIANIKIISPLGDKPSIFPAEIRLLSVSSTGGGYVPEPDPGQDDPTEPSDSESILYEGSLYISGNSTESIKITQAQLVDTNDIVMTLSGTPSNGPRLAIVNSAWKNWKEVNPYKSEGGKYYFSYSDILAAWGGTKDTIAYVYAIGQSSTLLKLASVPVSGTEDTKTELEKVNDMTLEEVIKYVNDFTSDFTENCVILTEAQMRAVERVIEGK